MKKKRGSSLGRGMKKFEKVVSRGTPMYQGESPSTPDPVKVKAMEKRAAAIASKLDVELRVYMEQFVLHKTHKAAWLSLHPECHPSTAGRQGWRQMEKIREVISEREIHAMLGLSGEAVISAIGRGLVARAKKDFILPKTGEIISTPDYDDTANQLAAASIGAKVLNLIRDAPPVPVLVNLIQYGDPNAPTWPGGGRDNSPLPPNTRYVQYEPPTAQGRAVDLGGPKGRED
jgi:hypothetical protein